MKNKLYPFRTVLRFALTGVIILSLFLGTADYFIEDSYSCREGVPISSAGLLQITASEDICPVSTESSRSYQVRLLGVLPLKEIHLRTFGNTLLCPGGMPFGAKIFTNGLIVVGFTEIDCTSGSKQPALDAGIHVKDIILEINEKPINGVEDLAEYIGTCDGNVLNFKLRRGEDIISLPVTPSLSLSENKYKTGMFVRDNTAGIGTVTFIDPQTGEFAGLGHGICDGSSGALLPLSRGIVMDVTISGVQKGTSGVPGELKGFFSSGKKGTLNGNSDAGVFGVLSVLPIGVSEETAIPIALKNEIQDGAAQIFCTLDESGIHAYDVTIRKIRNTPDNKNMEVIVTDPRLIEKTGGIVQGMSGSPILQNGRIVGAVTHVLVNDPTRGYGIFIENMLEAAGNSIN